MILVFRSSCAPAWLTTASCSRRSRASPSIPFWVSTSAACATLRSPNLLPLPSPGYPRLAPNCAKGHRQPGVNITCPLSVTEMGFSLHAATTASADNARGRDALFRYALRPPIAQMRLHMLRRKLGDLS